MYMFHDDNGSKAHVDFLAIVVTFLPLVTRCFVERSAANSITVKLLSRDFRFIIASSVSTGLMPNLESSTWRQKKTPNNGPIIYCRDETFHNTISAEGS
jgi:hypothetical protein